MVPAERAMLEFSFSRVFFSLFLSLVRERKAGGEGELVCGFRGSRGEEHLLFHFKDVARPDLGVL